MKDCVFCKIVCGEIPLKFIYENDSFVSFPDANPLTEGHVLVVSKKHFETILDMPSNIGVNLIDCVKNTALKIISQENAEGFNVIQNNKEVAGQVVRHLHFHIIPRKKNDKIKLVSK